MEVRKVNSSNIDQIGYDASKKVLRVVFKSGKVYDYSNVDEQTYNSLQLSSSKGQYFNNIIRSNFEFRRIL